MYQHDRLSNLAKSIKILENAQSKYGAVIATLNAQHSRIKDALMSQKCKCLPTIKEPLIDAQIDKWEKRIQALEKQLWEKTAQASDLELELYRTQTALTKILAQQESKDET